MSLFLRKRGIVDEAAGLKLAELCWFRYAMGDTITAHEKGRLKHLFTVEKNGIIAVMGRAKEGLQSFFGKGFLPVIIAANRVSFLLML